MLFQDSVDDIIISKKDSDFVGGSVKLPDGGPIPVTILVSGKDLLPGRPVMDTTTTATTTATTATTTTTTAAITITATAIIIIVTATTAATTATAFIFAIGAAIT
jgi:hypothetical protein